MSTEARQHHIKKDVRFVLTALVLLVALILVNLGVSLLPKDLTQIDTTYNQLFTLSDTTESLLSAVNESVTLYFVCEDGVKDDTIGPYLDLYAAENPQVTVKVIDPVKNPLFLADYSASPESVTNYSIVVSSSRRSLLIDYYDLYFVYNEYLGNMTLAEYSTYASDPSYSYILQLYSTVYYFNGESKISNAISYVTATEIPKVYLLTGHGELKVGDGFIAELHANAYETVTDFSLFSAGSIPEDCALLVINAPERDLSDAESTAIEAYMQKGGNLLLVTRTGLAYKETKDVDSDLPNLMHLLSLYGLSGENGVIVEQNANYRYSNYYNIMLPAVNTTHPITTGFQNTFMIFYGAHAITVNEGKGDAKVTSLFTTSDSSYTNRGTEGNHQKDETSVDGPFSLGVIAESETMGKLSWFSSENTLNDTANLAVSGGNYTYLISTVNHMLGREDMISVPSISLEEPLLVLNNSQVTVFATVFCAVIPGGILLFGLLYWRKRRRA